MIVYKEEKKMIKMMFILQATNTQINPSVLSKTRMKEKKMTSRFSFIKNSKKIFPNKNMLKKKEKRINLI